MKPSMRSATRLRFQLPILTATRLSLNTGYRLLYPFMPVFARALGVNLGALSAVVAVRSLLGIASPILGTGADVRGRKQAMLAGLSLFCAAMALVGLWPGYAAFFVGMVLAGAAKIVFDPAVQAYLGDRVSYNRRGLAIALAESAWSGSFLVGAPLVGWLIARQGWHSPFLILALLGGVACIILWRTLPADQRATTGPSSILGNLRAVLKHRPAMAALCVSLLLGAASESISIVYSTWLEGDFSLYVTALGVASLGIGLAELAGEGLVAILADRLNLRRAVLLGTGCFMLSSALLPLLGRTLAGALAGLALFFVCYEFAIVSLIAYLTEAAPSARATLMGGNIAAISAGRLVGALVAPSLFSLGLVANGLAAMAFNMVALILFLFLARVE